MATISKVQRAGGIAWKARIRENGEDKYSQTFKLKKDAKAWADRMERNADEARAHGNQLARTLTLKKLIEEYSLERTLDSGTLVNLKWWKGEYGERRVLSINDDTVREGLQKLRAGKAHRGDGKGKRKATTRPRANATLNRHKSALSGCWQYGREIYKLPENPCRQVKAYPEGKGRIRFLSDAERKVLLKACKASKWEPLYLLVLMAITTGARQGELMRLCWRDLDLKSRRAYVYESKNGEPRVLPLTDEVVSLLKAMPRPLDSTTLIFPAMHYRKSGEGERKARRLIVSDPHKPCSFRPYWDKALAASKIENFRFHDLRHTCASYLAQNNATLLQIADVLGHKQLEVTKRYSHLCVDHKQDLVDRVLGGVK